MIDLPRWLERLLGLDPVPPPPHVFALDARELRYGAFHRSAQGLVFGASRSVELPHGTVPEGPLGGPLHDPAAFQATVAELVSGLPGPLKAATLVLPDAWLRLTFLELEELPKRARDRDEVLRWKLKRLVPFRVEDLRLASCPMKPLPGGAPHRLLVGFALEALLEVIEGAFLAAGVEIGRIVPTSLALAGAVETTTPGDGLTGVLAVFAEAFTLTVLGNGEPILYRYKAQPAETPEAVLVQAARRDLRLTASYLAESLPGRQLSQLFLAAPDEVEASWVALAAEELGATIVPLGFEHLALARLQPSVPRLETAPLVGAARLEVAAA